MGQKINPVGFRLGISQDWRTKGYAEREDYRNNLLVDLEARRFVEEELASAAIGLIEIERAANKVSMTIHAGRPGVIFGQKGKGAESVRDKVSKIMKAPVSINIKEIRKTELNAKLVGEGVARQLEQRVMFRRAMKRAVSSAMRAGALGIKIRVSGRLGGAEIARSEWYNEGRLPLHTLRADIDYAISEAKSTYGIIGVKVWIFKGEVVAKKPEEKVSSKQKETEASED